MVVGRGFGLSCQRERRVVGREGAMRLRIRKARGERRVSQPED